MRTPPIPEQRHSFIVIHADLRQPGFSGFCKIDLSDDDILEMNLWKDPNNIRVLAHHWLLLNPRRYPDYSHVNDFMVDISTADGQDYLLPFADPELEYQYLTQEERF